MVVLRELFSFSTFLLPEKQMERFVKCIFYVSTFLLPEEQVLLFLLMLVDEKWPIAFLLPE